MPLTHALACIPGTTYQVHGISLNSCGMGLYGRHHHCEKDYLQS